nr:zinc finger, CCHC-type [Tanacetum cinerariifolium]
MINVQQVAVVRSARLYDVIMIIIRGRSPESRGSGGNAHGSWVQGAAAPGRVQGAEPLAGILFGLSSLAKEDALSSYHPESCVHSEYTQSFDIYQNAESAKALWESLESKYMAEDASATKFLVSSFMNYKMVDNRPVMEQYHEMLRILRQYTQHNLMMDEAISVAVIIDKLPPFWKEFKHGLKLKKEELNLVQLGSHLRIEEGLRSQKLDNNPKGKNQIGSSSDNMIERDGAKNSNNNKNKRK